MQNQEEKKWVAFRLFASIEIFRPGFQFSHSITTGNPGVVRSVDAKLKYTAISRKVVGKNVHATIPKGNMGYDRYTVPGDCSCRTYYHGCFPLALANTFSWPFVPILSIFSEEQGNQNHSQCLSGLSRALFPKTFLEIAVYLRNDVINKSRAWDKDKNLSLRQELNL